jgi:pyruvate kinase
VDWVGLSFVRSARDIIELKGIIRQREKHARVIAKIEKPEALKEIDEIIRESDALMVARGDLGVEIPMEKVPLVQKDIIRRCLAQHRPVIVATQMMESMITNITPTRAEVNDVANAVLDHADAGDAERRDQRGQVPRGSGEGHEQDPAGNGDQRGHVQRATARSGAGRAHGDRCHLHGQPCAWPPRSTSRPS